VIRRKLYYLRVPWGGDVHLVHEEDGDGLSERGARWPGVWASSFPRPPNAPTDPLEPLFSVAVAGVARQLREEGVCARVSGLRQVTDEQAGEWGSVSRRGDRVPH
jgi:hypothetical protein